MKNTDGGATAHACALRRHAGSLLYHYGRALEFFDLHEKVPGGYELVEFHDASHASHYLRGLISDWFNRRALCDVASKTLPCYPPGPVENEEIIRHLSELLRIGWLRLARVPQPSLSNALTTDEQAAERYVEESRGFIRIEVVDDESGVPMSNVFVSVFPPDGRETKRTTGSDGIVYLDRIARGTFRVTSTLGGRRLDESLAVVEGGGGGGSGAGRQSHSTTGSSSQTRREPSGLPRALATIEEHRVHTGETLASLARSCDLTWAQLAHFNWGIDKPSAINEHLRIDVGCTKKTHDGHNYVFDDADSPGIVYLPKRWSREGLATNETHTIRVRRVHGPTRPFGMCRAIEGYPINGKWFVIKEDGNEVFAGETDADGLINVPFAHAERYEVWFETTGTSAEG